MSYEEISEIIKLLSQSGINSKQKALEYLRKAQEKIIQHQIEYLSNKDIYRKTLYKFLDIKDDEGNYICERYEKEFDLIEEVIKKNEEKEETKC
jgi:hypothetical protein